LIRVELIRTPFFGNRLHVVITLSVHSILAAVLCQVFITGGYRYKEPSEPVDPEKGSITLKEGTKIFFTDQNRIVYYYNLNCNTIANNMNFYDLYKNCRLCPRNCGVNRLDEPGEKNRGFCGQDSLLRVSYIGPHFGEEPPISGKRGSGTIFFSGCSLKCSFCQNYQISKDGLGKSMTLKELFENVTDMISIKKVHNINFVTPDHFFPHVFDLVIQLREKGYTIPFVYNLSGYQSVEILKIAEDYSNIYMPDFKYSDDNTAKRFSKCGDYSYRAIEAVSEMVRQKGFLEYNRQEPEIAQEGVLIRHLIIPGNTDNSTGVLDTLFLEFGPLLPISLMSQYYPVLPNKDPDLNRKLTMQEFDKVYKHALDLGFENLFVQFPDENPPNRTKPPVFLPDFNKESPFLN
jgi:putative pyruvate formate lyase activating enzyme